MRYAMHKLVIMVEREEALRTKVSKDAGQVAALVEYGLLRSPAALKAAAQDLMARGTGWRRRAAEGLRHVKAVEPGVGERLGAVLKMSAPAKTKKVAPRAK